MPRDPSNPGWVPEIFMWDELSAASVLDPSLITETREMYIDVDISHGIQYGYTLAWELGQHEPTGAGKAVVHVDVDLARFYAVSVQGARQAATSPDPHPSGDDKPSEHRHRCCFDPDHSEKAMTHLPKLPAHHKDPFDRMLVCQSLEHGLIFVTSDPFVRAYPVKTLW